MNRSRQAANYAFLFFLFLSIFFLIFPTSKFVQSFKVLAGYTLHPELSTISKYERYLKDIPLNVLNLIKADLRNRELEEKVKRLEIENERLKSVSVENRRLSNALSISTSLPYKGIFARVISRDPVNLYNSFFIDKGSKHFIKENYPVLAFEEGKYGLIGRIFEVYEDYSRVLLITDLRLSFIGSIEEKTINFLVKGQNSSRLILDYINSNDIIKIGDIIKTSPDSITFPPHLPVGVILEVYPGKSAMNFYSALAVPIVKIEKVREVFVLEYETELRKQLE